MWAAQRRAIRCSDKAWIDVMLRNCDVKGPRVCGNVECVAKENGAVSGGHDEAERNGPTEGVGVQENTRNGPELCFGGWPRNREAGCGRDARI
ncbi:hypothetical protein SASPL_156997 [Salvia splendens]|uniref:Uncharacterized protein n=1 Tax=Salvia splendens TaxID=180675 RepID=A0A8X8VVQ1_SALSN|nr:hypothetical protein SASPL_156997 [Salvia splendens]